MSEFKILSISEQIAVHLRREIARGRWSGRMPGRNELARQLGVGITNVEVALRQLEDEGKLVAQGAGRMRRIAAIAQYSDKRRIRVAILGYERSTMSDGIFSEAVHVLREAGHDAFFTRSSLVEMGMNVKRIASPAGNHRVVCPAAGTGVRPLWAPTGRPTCQCRTGQGAGLCRSGAAVDRTRAPEDRHALPTGPKAAGAWHPRAGVPR